jgi:acetyl esterase/lipase
MVAANAAYDVTEIAFGQAGDAPLIARLYSPKGKPAFPAIVDVHGGAWTGGSRMDNASMHAAMAASGIMVLALEFRLAPATPYPGPVADINLGIRWLKANAARLGADPERIGGLGTSSGGHQLLLNVLRPGDPRYAAWSLADAADAGLAYLVVCWPISDPVARYHMAQQTGNDRLVNNHRAYFGTEAVMLEASPQHIVDGGPSLKLPPALLIQGTKDANVTPDMADRFAAAYAKAGGQMVLKKYDGQPHAFIPQNPTAPASVEALRLIIDFIHRQAA